MAIGLRRGDAIRDDDELVIRAGGGSVDALVEQAPRRAAGYQRFVDSGEIRSPYAISVNVVRVGVLTLEQVLVEEPYINYKPYLDAKAGRLADLPWVQIVATTPVHGRPLTLVEITHHDVHALRCPRGGDRPRVTARVHHRGSGAFRPPRQSVSSQQAE